MHTSTPASERGDVSRKALIEAALIEFASHSYHAASNRDIADRAGVNQALIAYHFGGKEGLYLAVFENICERIQERLQPALQAIGDALTAGATQASHEQKLELLLQLLERVVRLFADPGLKTSAQLVLQEQQQPTRAFDILYRSFMQEALQRVTDLVQLLRPDKSRDEVSLLVITLLGQALVFRAARTTVLRHLQWDDIKPAQLQAIIHQVRANVLAILSSQD
ncbi:CerR family C-terminal domain-containing protein [Pseudomaricurvus sp. HS19]|uniref:CerR family C-terminal domain-containing protein n=1 Tax=Pseudomaricurvus sp. HS19 TaxID=2692626 RepID=UPI00136962EC|nr:CerR family C-terminal domain-containing protein [Pseudomaricurvus sp. HS19]MYM64473.1 CerR family C-terminal domain-containing protein [Pseudomaricurvus sp. HS19]